MSTEYRLVEKVGDMPLDESMVADFLKYVESLPLAMTHVREDDEQEDNQNYNKYIIFDDIFCRFFNDEGDYHFFLDDVIHTALIPLPGNKKDEQMLKKMLGCVHAFFIEYYRQFFVIRISISITNPESHMHYHRDLAGENADRFLVDLTDPQNTMSGIEVEDRLYSLQRFGVYKLDTTRLHRAANYSRQHRKISFIIQCISDLNDYLEYQRKHLEVFMDARAQSVPYFGPVALEE